MKSFLLALTLIPSLSFASDIFHCVATADYYSVNDRYEYTYSSTEVLQDEFVQHYNQKAVITGSHYPFFFTATFTPYDSIEAHLVVKVDQPSARAHGKVTGHANLNLSVEDYTGAGKIVYRLYCSRNN